MIDFTPKKPCIKCGIIKPLTDFYTHRSAADKRASTCKECVSLQQKARRAKPDYKAKEKSEAHHETEGQLIQKLRGMGIYAAPGKSSEWKRLDTVAWGCVKIELKSSSYSRSIGYTFTFSPKQVKDVFVSDIVCLMLIKDGVESYHLFPSDHPVFFRTDGSRKRGFAYRPGCSTSGQSRKNQRRFGISLTDELMNQHKDNWSLIETVRNRISLELINEIYDADKSVLNFYSQKKLSGF